MRPWNPEVPGGARDPEVPGGARDPEVPGGAHDPMRHDVDGDEAKVPSVPNLLPGPSARQIVEHELTDMQCTGAGVAIALRSKGRALVHSSREEGELSEIGIDYGLFDRDKEDVLPILCVKCRNSSTGCVGATVVDRKGASDYASSFLTAFTKSLGFKRILVSSDNERLLSSLIERVTCNLTGVELVLMTHARWCEEVNENCENAGTREMGSRVQCNVCRSSLAVEAGSTKSGETCCT